MKLPVITLISALVGTLIATGYGMYQITHYVDYRLDSLMAVMVVLSATTILSIDSMD